MGVLLLGVWLCGLAGLNLACPHSTDARVVPWHGLRLRLSMVGLLVVGQLMVLLVDLRVGILAVGLVVVGLGVRLAGVGVVVGLVVGLQRKCS